MEITENQRNWCLKIIAHLFKWKLTSFFRHPVDPEADDMPGYYEKVTRPMDLETVKKTLLDGNYANVSSFLADLRLIWENTKTYFGPDSVMTFIADEVLQYLTEQEKSVNLSAEQVWYNQLTVIQAKIEKHVQRRVPISTMPMSPRQSRRG
jgi:hypothetical protein